MITKRIYILSYILLLALPGVVIQGQNMQSYLEDFSESQIALISEYLAGFPDHTQISMAKIVGDKVSFLGIGKDGKEISFKENRNSVFEIGSITKVFTASILSQMVLDSLISLDSPIQGILSFTIRQISKGDIPITFKTLANHTSGLAFEPDNLSVSMKMNPSNPYLAYDFTLFDDYLQNSLEINSIPGTSYCYSNLGFGLLGYLLEVKSGKDYETLLNELVFNRFEMQSSTTVYDEIQRDVVPGLDTAGKFLPHWDCGSLVASGGILSSAQDLSNFIRANFSDDPVLDLQRQKTYSNMNNHTALGWEIFEIGGGRCTIDWYYKTGGMGGYSAAVIMDTKARYGIVLLSNISAYHEDSNILQTAIELLKDIYVNGSDKAGVCEAPFLEMALNKGWGTWSRSASDSALNRADIKNPLVGVWQKSSTARSHLGIDYETRTFMPDGKAQADFTGNPEIDVWGYYHVTGHQIEFEDIGGNACKTNGTYQFSVSNDTLTFHSVEDGCNARVSGLSGTWIRKK